MGGAQVLHRGALIAAFMTGLLALPIGLMATHESIVVRAGGFVGLAPDTISGPVGEAMMVGICAALFALQYYSTKAAGMLAFAGLRPRAGK